MKSQDIKPLPIAFSKEERNIKPLPVPTIIVHLLLEALEIHVGAMCQYS